MKWSQILLQLLLSLSVTPGREAPEHRASVDVGAVAALDGPLADGWTPKTARVQGSLVRLNGLGIRTHANWVLFQLPFDTTRRDRIRAVQFRPSSSTPTEVGALRIGSVCLSVRAAGEVEEWARYTTSGLGQTNRFIWHPAPPTTDPTILGINVPTRVANYSACYLDDGHLIEPENWSLEIEWEQR
jgi:hypothetical protein